MTKVYNKCPACQSSALNIFYEVEGVPAHSVLLLPTNEAAVNFPKGDIRLAFCRHCGFISNVSFNPALLEYSSKYEETQGFSETFNEFHRHLVQKLIQKYRLRDKTIIEIGCGKGEFLTLLCELGGNDGVGFDPSYIAERNPKSKETNVIFVKDFYSEKYTHYKGDFVCCKMTLEHIPAVFDFVRLIQHSLNDSGCSIIFFQVPNISRILQDLAFWDIYHEHCSYFSEQSLSGLFKHCGYEVLDLYTGYDDQYLMIEAQMAMGPAVEVMKDVSNVSLDDVTYFQTYVQNEIEKWHNKIVDLHQSGKKIVIWGGGSKGVAFLTTLGIRNEIEYAVDINPFKHGTFMAGSGQRIVAPEFLTQYLPDYVIIMNPIYKNEISRQLTEMGVDCELMTV